MNHGFLILTHFPPQQAYEQVIRLDSANSYFFIHFDKKLVLDEADPHLVRLQNMPNVHLIADRVDVHWAGFSTLEATVKLLKAGLSQPSADRFHFMSGQCMPVKPLKYINSFFEQNKGKEFLEYFLMPRDGYGLTHWRIDKYHLYDHFHPRGTGMRNKLMKQLNSGLRGVQRLLKKAGIYRRYPHAFPTPYAGAAYWSLTRNACEHMMRFIAGNPAFYERLKFTQSADEMMIQTLLMASPYATNVVNKTLRFANFIPPASSPTPLTMSNLSQIERDDVLFARKFTAESKALLEYLDKHVLGRANLI